MDEQKALNFIQSDQMTFEVFFEFCAKQFEKLNHKKAENKNSDL